MDTPLGGERLGESGVERVLEVAHKKGKYTSASTSSPLMITVHSTRNHRTHEVRPVGQLDPKHWENVRLVRRR